MHGAGRSPCRCPLARSHGPETHRNARRACNPTVECSAPAPLWNLHAGLSSCRAAHRQPGELVRGGQAAEAPAAAAAGGHTEDGQLPRLRAHQLRCRQPREVSERPRCNPPCSMPPLMALECWHQNSMLRFARNPETCRKSQNVHYFGRRRRGVSGEGGERQGEPLLLRRAGRRPLDAGAPQGAAGGAQTSEHADITTATSTSAVFPCMTEAQVATFACAAHAWDMLKGCGDTSHRCTIADWRDHTCQQPAGLAVCRRSRMATCAS